MIEELFDAVDVSFKWILLGFNFLTIVFVYLHKRRNKQPRQHNILFVTAHPDDECMFFRPTIAGLKSNYIIHLLCLSGKETNREQELVEAARVVNIDHASCIKDQKLVDGMKQKWCEQTIRKYVVEYVIANKIKAIFTFDQAGVSGHANHRSIYYALKQLQTKQIKQLKQTKQTKQTKQAKQTQQTKQNREPNIKIYYLESVALPRKYTGLLQFPLSILKTYSWIEISPFNAYSAMAKHKSQFVWYRQLWIFLSRYQYINTYQRAIIKIASPQN